MQQEALLIKQLPYLDSVNGFYFTSAH